MIFLPPYQAKPPFGTRLLPGGVRGIPAPGLFYSLAEMAGYAAHDSGSTGLTLSTSGFGSANPWTGNYSGAGLLCNGNGYGLKSPIPSSLQVGWPQTLAVGFRRLGTFPATSPAMAGGFQTASPYASIGIYAPNITPNTQLGGTWSSGTSGIATPTTAVFPATDCVASLTVTPTSGTLYANGVQGAQSTGTYASPDYAGVDFEVGDPVNNRNINCVIYWVAWWPVALSPAQHALIGSSVNAIWSLCGSPLSAAALMPRASSFMPWIYGDQTNEIWG